MSAIESKVRVLKRMPTQADLPHLPGQNTEFFEGEWRLPDQNDLPCEDGAFVNNNLELPQSLILSGSLWQVLEALNPHNDFLVGQDLGIYWTLTDPPLDGAIAPDWFYVPNVSPMPKGEIRRSYIMWQELESPRLLVEYVSGDGSVERDRTPHKGKFWIYERAVRAHYYVIYDVVRASIEVQHLENDRYRPVPANENGRFPIPTLGIEFGLWKNTFWGMTVPWLRAWDSNGNLLPIDEERALRNLQRAEQEKQRAEQENNVPTNSRFS